jgi:hypothetical protein
MWSSSHVLRHSPTQKEQLCQKSTLLYQVALCIAQTFVERICLEPEQRLYSRENRVEQTCHQRNRVKKHMWSAVADFGLISQPLPIEQKAIYLCKLLRYIHHNCKYAWGMQQNLLQSDGATVILQPIHFQLKHELCIRTFICSVALDQEG